MPKLIVTSRYLKATDKKKIYHFVKYIATREGAVAVKIEHPNATVSTKQQELISSLLENFPDSKNLFEYEDFKNNPTQKTASNLISSMIDSNMERLTNRKNYVDYLANRPGAVKLGSHGLFSLDSTPINLEKTAREISEHRGNVWTHVASLRRDNAQKMGYDNLSAWQDLIKRQIPNIAKNQKIDMRNLRWYAAFHDKETNPHVHIVVYSENEKEGFLTKQGIEKIRSGFANDIYQNELHHLYAHQTQLRDSLKQESAEFMLKLSEKAIDNPQLSEHILRLYKQLQTCKGKKIYGYLKPEIKRSVDEIFQILASDETIKKMYKLWCEMEQQKHDVYSSARVDFPSLVDNIAFKSVKNMIIGQVQNIHTVQLENDEEIVENFVEIDVASADNFNDFYEPKIKEIHPKINWSKPYKTACSLLYKKDATIDEIRQAEKLLLAESNSGNILATHDLGKLYSMDKFDFKDEEKSGEFYKKALEGFVEIEPNTTKLRSYVQYRIGKMYCYGHGTEQNYSKSFEWFLKSSQPSNDENFGNKFAQYSLANLYFYGNGVVKDLQKAFQRYQKSASQNQPYASYSLAQFYIKGGIVEKNEDTAQEHFKNALAGFLKMEMGEQADDNLFYKIGTMCKNGLGTEINVQKSIEYFKQSAQLGNKNGLYEYGKYLLENMDVMKGLECLEKAILLENINTKRYLASEYISGEIIEQDIEKGITMLTELSEHGDAFSAYRLGKLYFKGEVVSQDFDKAERYLKIASDENEYAQYLLGKLYLTEEKYDLSKAIKWLEMAEKHASVSNTVAYALAKIYLEDNEFHSSEKAIYLLEKSASEISWSAFLLGRLYLYGNDEIPQNKDKAIEYLNLSASQGNAYAQDLLEHMNDFENAMIGNTIASLLVNLSRCIADDYIQKFQSNKLSVDRKLRKMIQEKKLAHGQKQEFSQEVQ